MDAKIKKALALLAEGKTRDEVAKRLDYKNYKVLDMYFRRRNYRWNASRGTYVQMEALASEPVEIQEVVLSKPQQIIKLLSLPSKDPRDVAKQVGFRDIQQMADYMADRGFSWDSRSWNYVRNTGLEMVEAIEEDGGSCPDAFETAAPTRLSGQEVKAQTGEVDPPVGDIEQFLPLLALLENNKDKLIDLITMKHERRIPRYTLAGACTAKSLQIPIVLDKLVKDFSNEKNLTQKDMLTVALIEFLMKYGFEAEVEYMLNAGRS